MNVNIDIRGVILKTKRLVLRPFELCDLDDLYEYAKVEGVGEMAGWSHHKSREESMEILTMFIESKITFAITLNNKVIGSLGIEEYNEDKLPELDSYKGRELGFVLSKDYWGQGIMKEALEVVIDYLFNTLNLDVLVCGHFDFNENSRKVQQKVGFFHYKKYILHYCDKECMGWYSLLFKDPKLNLLLNKNVAYCGLNCTDCEARIATVNHDEDLKCKVAKDWSALNGVEITKDMINCVGCRIDGVKTVFCDSLCEIKKCAISKGYHTCGECSLIDSCETIKMIISNNKDAYNNLH